MRFKNNQILEKIAQQYRDDFIRCFLKVHKPHFDFQKFENQETNYNYGFDIYHNSDCDEYQDQINDNYDKFIINNRITRIKVYDNLLKKQKMLIMFENLNEDELKYQQKLKRYINIFNKFPSNNIILNLYDSYQIEFFYIFEIESYDLTSKDLEIKYQIPQNDLNNLIRKKLSNFQSILGLKKRQKKQKELLWYINFINESQISIKFNLFDFQNQLLQLNSQSDNIDDNLSPSEENFTQGSQLLIQQQNNFNQDEKEKENIEQVRKNMLQKISDCFKLEFQAIKKQDFLEQIQQKYSNMLKFHSLEIFKVIQQHPQYDNFEIYSSSQQDFSLKLKKRHTKISLVGIKFTSIQEAQQMEDQYKRLLQLSGQFKSNLISTEILVYLQYNYLLLEYERMEKQINQTDFVSFLNKNNKMKEHEYSDKSDSEESIHSIDSDYNENDDLAIKNDLSKISYEAKMNEEKSDLSKEDDEIECEEFDDEISEELETSQKDGYILRTSYYYRNIVNLLKKLIEISYELKQQNFIITKIDPLKIIIEMQQNKYQKEIKRLWINSLGLKCFKQCYMNMVIDIFQKLEKFYSSYWDGSSKTDHRYSSIQEFFTMISNEQIQNNEEILKKQYQNIINILDLLYFVVTQQMRQYNYCLKIYDQRLDQLVYFQDSYLDFKSVQFYYQQLINNKEKIFWIKLVTNKSYSFIQQQQKKNLFSFHNKIESNIDSNNQQEGMSEAEINNELIQQIGFNKTAGYNKYNIGLSICQEIQSLRMLSLCFKDNFNYEIIFKLPNFLKLSEQILWLELILETTEKEQNILYLIDQINNYQNINCLVIKARDDAKIKQKALKLQRLVCFQFKKTWSSYSYNRGIDNELGFLL
ncbi:hypothetical protein ABPG74_006817 [Tetrahymena malaccensis]